MPVRRPLALTAGALLLAVPALSSCGFDYPTDRVNTITNGVSERSASVAVLNAVIVAGQPDSGTLVALLSNKTQEPRTLVGVRGAEDGSIEVSETEVGLFPRASANLANEESGITVEGDFEPGDFIDMIFTFDSGEEVTLPVHVVLNCDEYAGLDVTAESEESESSTETAEVEVSQEGSEDAIEADVPGPDEEEGEAGGGAVIKTEPDQYTDTEQYSCEYPEKIEK